MQLFRVVSCHIVWEIHWLIFYGLMLQVIGTVLAAKTAAPGKDILPPHDRNHTSLSLHMKARYVGAEGERQTDLDTEGRNMGVFEFTHSVEVIKYLHQIMLFVSCQF